MSEQFSQMRRRGEAAEDGEGVGTLARVRSTSGALEFYARASIAESTVRAYRGDLRDFLEWCESHDQEPLPATPEGVMLYLEELADGGRSWATIERRIAAIAKVHRLKDLTPPSQDPKFREAIRGLKRLVGAAPKHRKRAILFHDLTQMVRMCPPTRAGLRDRAVLLIGWACGLRRSELVGLDVEDFEWRDVGAAIRIRRSKTDPYGEGQVVPLFKGRDASLCPPTALQQWFDVSRVDSGPVFRSVDRYDAIGRDRLRPRSILRIVQRAAERIGMDRSTIGAHSLRSGLVTSAIRGGATPSDVMAVTRHRSYKGLRPYIEAGKLFESNPAAKAGL